MQRFSYYLLKKIFLISYYFEPFKGVGAKRMSYWANAFFSEGNPSFECIVITATPQPEHKHNVIFVEDKKNLLIDRFIQGMSWIASLKDFFNTFKQNPDYIIISGGPFGHFGITRFLKRKFRAKIILDYRDPFSNNSRFKTFFIKNAIKKAYERRFLKSADYLITVNNFCRQLLSKNFASERIFVVENGFDDTTLELIDGERFSDALIHIVYAGSFYSDRDPTLFLTQLLKFEKQEKKFCFHHIGNHSEFLKSFKESGVLVEHGEKSYTETIELMKKCSVGLIITSGEPMESTTKIYDYIGCDLDILVITDGQLRTGSIHDVTSLIEEKTIWLRNRPSDIDRFFETASVQKGGIPDKGRFARKRGYEILREILNKV